MVIGSLTVCRIHFKNEQIIKRSAGKRYLTLVSGSIPSLHLNADNSSQPAMEDDQLMLDETAHVELESPTDGLTHSQVR